MAQYSIPQFIEEEGKIIFFMTFRQFFLLIAGGIICVALYLTLPFIAFLIGSLIVMGFFGMVAFLKIENERVTKVFLHFIDYSTKNKDFVWRRGDQKLDVQQMKEEAPEIKVGPIAPTKPIIKTTTKSRLSETKKSIELSNR